MTQKEHSPETEIALFKQNQEFIKSQLGKLVIQVEKISEALSGISRITEIQIEIKTQQILLTERIKHLEDWKLQITANVRFINWMIATSTVLAGIIGTIITYFITKK